MSGPVNPKAAPGEETSGNAKASGKRAKARALDAFSRITLDEFEDELRGYRRPQAETALFGGYAFADYRGDVRDAGGGVVLAVALGAGEVRIVRGVSSRRTLAAALGRILVVAARANVRLLFGQDHQYGIPLVLANELGLVGDWRQRMRQLFVEGELARSARDGKAGEFAAAVNASLVAAGRAAYFFSHTKGGKYGIPTSRPRPKDAPSERRLTEAAHGFPFCHVGDNGSVGGQSIVGIPYLLALLEACEREQVPVSVWPFDGLSLDELAGHVAVEPYPSLYRDEGVVQTDENDAVACVTWMQRHDRDGSLARRLELRAVPSAQRARVQLEGWIAGVEAMVQ